MTSPLTFPLGFLFSRDWQLLQRVIIIGRLKTSKISTKDPTSLNYNSSELCKLVEYSFLSEQNHIDIHLRNGSAEVNMSNAMQTFV